MGISRIVDWILKHDGDDLTFVYYATRLEEPFTNWVGKSAMQ